MPASGPDRWGSLGTGADRASPKIATCRRSKCARSTTFPSGGATKTVGGRYVFHHMTYSSVAQGEGASTADAEAAGTSWPIHEVGRNADIFPPEAGRLLQKNSSLALERRITCTRTAARPRRTSSSASSSSRRATSRSTSARRLRLGNGIDLDVKPDQREPGAALLRHAAGAHQDHRVRAAPARAGRAHVPRGDLGPQHPARSTASATTTTGSSSTSTRTTRRRCCPRAPSCT